MSGGLDCHVADRGDIGLEAHIAHHGQRVARPKRRRSEDDGPGVPENERERIFQPYLRGASPRSEQ